MKESLSQQEVEALIRDVRLIKTTSSEVKGFKRGKTLSRKITGFFPLEDPNNQDSGYKHQSRSNVIDYPGNKGINPTLA